MSTRPPTIRQLSWLGSVPQIVALVGAIVLGFRWFPNAGPMSGAGAYLLYAFGSRRLLTRAHRAGIASVKRQDFHAAIPSFERSLEFFDRFPWVDKYRSIVLMSASAISYREMGLANIGFCYSQLGNGAEARRYYERCLELFPESGVATAALRLMDAARSQDAV